MKSTVKAPRWILTQFSLGVQQVQGSGGSSRPFCFKGNRTKTSTSSSRPLTGSCTTGWGPGEQRTRGRARPRPSLGSTWAKKKKIAAAATTIAGTNQLKKLRQASKMPAGQSEMSSRRRVPSASVFSPSQHLDAFSRAESWVLPSLPEALQRRREPCGATAWPGPRATVQAAPSLVASLAPVRRTDWKISTQPESREPLRRQFRAHPSANPHPVES